MRKVLFFLVFLLIVAGIAFVERHTVLRVLAGTGAIKNFYGQATIPLPHVNKATAYNVYYSPSSNGNFSYSVRNLPSTMPSYTITYLRKNTAYQYKISALDKSGKEIWWSKISSFPPLQSM